VALAPRLKAAGTAIRSVRFDSGDLVTLSRSVRKILDAGGLTDVTIFASGGLDEDQLAALVAADAPIDGFGIGTSLTTSSDAPALDCAYKLEQYAGKPRRKLSPGKATWPGPKQVWRRYGPDGRMAADTLSTADDDHPGEPLVVPVMRRGQRLAAGPALTDIRRHAARNLELLPEGLRRLTPGAPYEVHVADRLSALAAEFDRHVRG
jgi:nicotinate phosphoribosyltransferase